MCLIQTDHIQIHTEEEKKKKKEMCKTLPPLCCAIVHCSPLTSISDRAWTSKVLKCLTDLKKRKCNYNVESSFKTRVDLDLTFDSGKGQIGLKTFA